MTLLRYVSVAFLTVIGLGLVSFGMVILISGGRSNDSALLPVIGTGLSIGSIGAIAIFAAYQIARRKPREDGSGGE